MEHGKPPLWARIGFAYAPKLTRAIVSPDRMASWFWRTGSSTNGVFTGGKFAGALEYPALFAFDHDILRMRTRKASWESPIARDMINRLSTHVINNGLTLEATPAWRIIDPKDKIPQEDRTAITREIQARWNLWANTTDCDATGKRTFQQKQGFAFTRRFVEGEVISIMRYSPDARLLSPVQLQEIDPDQVYDPNDQPTVSSINGRGNRLAYGFEIDGSGKESALYMYNFPNYGGVVSSAPSFGEMVGFGAMDATRIPKYGTKTHRLFYIHSFHAENIGQPRGISPLAYIVHELQKITDYGIAELEAAVINAMIAVWIEPSAEVGSTKALAGIAKRQEASGSSAASATGSREPVMNKPGIQVQTLGAGEKVNSFDTKRPNVNYGTFTHTVAMHLSGTVGLPVEFLELLFNSSYTAAKASMQVAYNAFAMARYDMAVEYCNPVYEQVITEWVNDNVLDLPGFSDSTWIRRAWLSASWSGIAMPSLNPTTEANAAAIRIKEGLTTRSKEARQYNGSDFADNVAALESENEELAEANSVLTPAEAIPFPTAVKAPEGETGAPPAQKQQQDSGQDQDGNDSEDATDTETDTTDNGDNAE